jgi:hypothetical protein
VTHTVGQVSCSLVNSEHERLYAGKNAYFELLGGKVEVVTVFGVRGEREELGGYAHETDSNPKQVN